MLEQNYTFESNELARAELKSPKKKFKSFPLTKYTSNCNSSDK